MDGVRGRRRRVRRAAPRRRAALGCAMYCRQHPSVIAASLDLTRAGSAGPARRLGRGGRPRLRRRRSGSSWPWPTGGWCGPGTAASPARTRPLRRRWPAGWPRVATCWVPPRSAPASSRARCGRIRTTASAWPWPPTRCTRRSRGRSIDERMPARADRVAVAMSGGVDSAVALLKALEAGLRPVGVTLRLWIDPRRARLGARLLLAAVGAGGPQRLPRGRRAARHARPARPLPLTGGGRLRARPRRGHDAQPVHALQRQLPVRRAGRLRRPGGRAPAGNRPLRPDRRAGRAHRAGARRRPRQGPVLHAGPACPSDPGAHLVPAGRAAQDRDARAGAAGRAGGGRPAREPGGLLRRRRRPPALPGAARRRRTRRASGRRATAA